MKNDKPNPVNYDAIKEADHSAQILIKPSDQDLKLNPGRTHTVKLADEVVTGLRSYFNLAGQSIQTQFILSSIINAFYKDLPSFTTKKKLWVAKINRYIEELRREGADLGYGIKYKIKELPKEASETNEKKEVQENEQTSFT